jgi:hypothetical protein
VPARALESGQTFLAIAKNHFASASDDADFACLPEDAIYPQCDFAGIRMSSLPNNRLFDHVEHERSSLGPLRTPAHRSRARESKSLSRAQSREPRRRLSYRRPSGLFNTEDRVSGASFQRPFATSRRWV